MEGLKLHKNFCLNGVTFSDKEELIDFSKSLDKNIYLFVHEWFNKQDFIVVNTSGSTGKPKKISLNKRHLTNSAKTTGKYFSLPEKSKALLCLSTDYIAGKMMLVRAIVLGWHIDWVPPSKEPLKNNSALYDFAAMVPMQVRHSLEKLGQIKTLIIGGAPITPTLTSKLRPLRTKVYLTYGMTETCTHIALKSINGTEDGKPLFHTLPGVTIDTDERGCLVIDAPLVSDQPVITNDLVKIYSPTSFEWLGRYDTVVNSGGVKLIPEQIEEKLSPVMDTRFFVYGFPDEALGEKLVLVIENSFSETVKTSDYKEKIDQFENLTAYEKPKQVFLVKQFMETPTGKIDKRRIMRHILNQCNS